MIIISPNLVLENVVGATNLDNPLLGYDSIVTINNVDASTEVSAHPVLELANERTDTFWQASGIANQTITITNSGNKNIDYVGIAGHNFKNSVSTIKIEGYTDLVLGEPDWIELIATHIPATNRPLLYRFEKEIYTAIRISIINSINVAPLISVLYCGELLVMNRKIFSGHSPINLNHEVDFVTGVSTNKNFLGRVVTGESSVSAVSFQNINPTWYRSYFTPFVKHAITKPFFWAWLPNTFPNDVGFAWTTGDIVPVNQRPNGGLLSVTFSMRGLSCID